MAKILNLDALSSKSAERELVIKGVAYPIVDMTVDNFIETTLTAERLAESKNVAEQIKATVDMICRSVPSAPRDVFGGYSLDILGKIAAFVRGDDVEGSEDKLAQARQAAAEQAGDAAGK